MEGFMKQVKEIAIVAVCLMLLGFGICMGIGTYLMYRDGEEEYDTLREYVAVEEPKENADGETPEESQKETVTVDFETLKKINPEIIAWIRIPNTKIDYPVVQGTDNEFYLKHTFKKTEHVAGSIFLDKDNSPDFSNRKSILYGHNMKDGSMFQGLHKYENEQYLKTHNKVYLYLPDGQTLAYLVIKCEYVKADSDTFWLAEQVETRTLLLSTCGSDSSKRLVLFCELPEEQEKITPDDKKLSMEIF